MGKRGPQPKPQTLKELEGNPGKRRLNDNAPEAVGSAIAPEYLPEYARQVWNQIVGSLPPQLYAACDSHLLGAYCIAADLHRKATESLEDGGHVATGQNGAPYQDPWVSILNKQAQLMATLGSRLGLDPAGRASLSVPQDKPKSKFEGLRPIRGGQTG